MGEPDTVGAWRSDGAFAAPGVYGALVIDAGWSPERFESWLMPLLATSPSSPG